MSRIGKKPIEIPKGVDIKVDGQTVTVKGPKGELTQSFDKDLRIELNDGVLTVERPNDIKNYNEDLDDEFLIYTKKVELYFFKLHSDKLCC